MDAVFAWIETSALSDWVRDSDCTCAFPIIVTLHNIGMAFLAGGSLIPLLPPAVFSLRTGDRFMEMAPWEAWIRSTALHAFV